MRNTNLSFPTIALLGWVLMGCGSAGGPQAGSSSSAASADPVASAGEACGGDSGVTCDAGLTCDYAPGPRSPSDQGRCFEHRGEGETCHATVWPPILCQEGLTCVAISTLAGASGVCRRATASAGEDCGGAAHVACQDGLSCDYAPEAQASDATGRCFEHRGEGEACNGTVWPPLLCASGLHCALDSTLIGAGGTCQPD